MENLRKLGILLMIFSLLCMNAELMAQYNEVIRDITSYCYEPSCPPENAIDNDIDTYYLVHPYVNCPQSYKNIQLDITLNRIIKAASIRIIASTPGIIVGVGNESNYHTTLRADETLFVVKPDGFETITLFRAGSGSVREISVEELVFDDINMPYQYSDGGNMIFRSFVLGGKLRSSAADAPDNITPDEEYIFEDMIGLQKVNIYPNPTRGEIRVDFGDALLPEQLASIEVYNINGAKISNLLIDKSSGTIDLSAQPNGIYLLIITIENEQTQWRVIKE